ncbi:hypothetical protein TCAL_15176 [Tigriopus californicus]|uniref:Uncharacterized protein n=1 Tax=Tigriopus californicus TaxID=6832 RepID=A0A553NFY4_TIGCA|nr:hypothetical protein TCAL_15176 [Tigriopus californicus]
MVLRYNLISMELGQNERLVNRQKRLLLEFPSKSRILGLFEIHCNERTWTAGFDRPTDNRGVASFLPMSIQCENFPVTWSGFAVEQETGEKWPLQ